MWSCKYSDCPACRKPSDWKDCLICVQGKIYDRPYIPTGTIDDHGELGPPPLETVEDYLDVLRRTTIQCPQDLPELKRAILPAWYDPANMTAYKGTRTREEVGITCHPDVMEYRRINRFKKVAIDPTDDRFRAFQDAVRIGWISGVYKTVCLTRVDLTENGMLMAMSDSKYCNLIKRPHKSNHVWFRANIDNPRVIYQFCHDDDCRATNGASTIKVSGAIWARLYPPDYVPANLKTKKRRKLKGRNLLPATRARR